MGDYGMKVSQPGYSVLTATDDKLIFSSKYSTFRVHSQGSGTMTTSNRTVTIAHNLGYVPAYLVHSDVSTLSFGVAGAYYPLPYTENQPLYSAFPSRDVLVWADTTNLYIKAESNFGYKYYFADDAASQFPNSIGVYYGLAEFGDDTIMGGDSHAAIKFDSVDIPQGSSIVSADLHWAVAGRGGSGDIFGRIVGIDQDDTNPFDSGDDPFNRPETSNNYLLHIGSGSGAGSEENWPVSNIVNEILGRAGWSSGNDIAFKIWNDNANGSTTDDNYEYASYYSSYLKILLSTTLLNYKYTIFKDQII